jgi:hypothetical protein
MRRIILACALAGILGVPAFGQGVDPIIGTWKLNLEKSTYTGAPTAPKNRTATFAGEGQNLAVTAEGVEANGQPLKVIFRHIYDGQPHPTTGSLRGNRERLQFYHFCRWLRAVVQIYRSNQVG